MKDIKYSKIFLAIAIVFSLPTITSVTVAHAIDYHIDATGGVRCDWCHDTHSFLYGLLQEVDAETVCLSCHEPGVNINAPDATIHAPLSATPITCVDCHDTHSNRDNYLDGTNTSLVGISYDSNGNAQGDDVARVIDSTDGTFYNVDFEDPDPKFVNFAGRDAIPGARRICQVCHIAPPSGNPHDMMATETNCTNCHKHSNGFKTGGGPP